MTDRLRHIAKLQELGWRVVHNKGCAFVGMEHSAGGKFSLIEAKTYGTGFKLSEADELAAWVAESLQNSLARADDDEPITQDWLLSIGFEMLAADRIVFQLGETIRASEQLYHWWVGEWLQRLPQPLVPKSRGQLRRLCEALGVEVKT